MHKKITLLLLFLSIVAISTKAIISILYIQKNTPSVREEKIKPRFKQNEDTILYWDYIDSVNNAQDWDAAKLDKNGNATYRGKLILTEKGLPLNNDNAYTTQEIKTMLALEGIKPKPGCDPSDPKNGSMGCYINNPDEVE